MSAQTAEPQEVEAPRADTATLADTSPDSSTYVQFADMPAAWVVVLVVLPLLAVLAFGAYWREPIPRVWRNVLGTLRFVSLFLLAAILARPVLVQQREEVYPAEVLVLVDDSASMRRQDAYQGDGAARAELARVVGGAPDQLSRAEQVRQAVQSVLVPMLEAGSYRARWLRFDAALSPWDPSQPLEGRGGATHLGDALVAALAQQRGRHITDVVVLSDGRGTGGIPIEEAARAASAAGLPVHTVVVGDTRPERNAVLELVDAPTAALEGDEIAIAVRASGRGSAAGARVEVLLEELGLAESGDAPGLGRLLDQKELLLDEAGQRLVLIAPPGRADTTSGERRLRVSLPPLDGETLSDDNHLEIVVRVSPEKVRVLYVEGYPRWEYRRLALDFLRRAESDIDFQAWLASATKDFPQEHSPGLPALTSLPITRRELLDNYDVVILGDVNPYSLEPDPARAEEFLESLRAFVEAGGGLLFQAGEFDNPRSFVGTPIEDLLPIVLDPVDDAGFAGDRTQAFRPRLESPLDPHEIVRLHPDPETNRRLIEEEGGLEGQFWYAPVARAKPGSEVLLRHPRDQNRHGNRVLLALGYFPQGRTMFMGLDSTWRWHFLFGPRYFERFWKGSLRWLALARLRGGDRRFRLEATRSTYDISERVVLEARVLDEDYRPSVEPEETVRYSGPDGEERELLLGAAGDRGGVYRGSLEVERPGAWRAWIDRGGERVAVADFEVVLPTRENQDPSPDPLSLSLLARLTGGEHVELWRLPTLSTQLPGGEERREPISSSLEDLWDHWWTLLLLVAVLATEWTLRKRLELV
ncbi:MAG: hypothetical protein GC161_11335 [Planctomycetaceae bacterium]|nr:hypothetical protein [Planctomycetaceae bacterium]